MASIVPSVLATNLEEYSAIIERIKPFAKRVHVDIADGVFAPNKTVDIGQAFGVDGAQLDLHLMLQHPDSELEAALALKPDLVIVHAEADCDHTTFIDSLRQAGVKSGLAILPATSIEQVKTLLPKIDHLLVFTGNLGFYGGELQAEPLGKIAQAKAINPSLEVSVDGGINQQTASQAIDAGADVLVSGGFITKATDPKAAYESLTAIAAGVPS